MPTQAWDMAPGNHSSSMRALRVVPTSKPGASTTRPRTMPTQAWDMAPGKPSLRTRRTAARTAFRTCTPMPASWIAGRTSFGKPRAIKRDARRCASACAGAAISIGPYGRHRWRAATVRAVRERDHRLAHARGSFGAIGSRWGAYVGRFFRTAGAMSHACVGMSGRSGPASPDGRPCPRKRGTWHPENARSGPRGSFRPPSPAPGRRERGSCPRKRGTWHPENAPCGSRGSFRPPSPHQDDGTDDHAHGSVKRSHRRRPLHGRRR